MALGIAIEARGLAKEFRSARAKSAVRAVNVLSFAIDRGEAVAFLGPNGAGKSTTIKMLCGILTPTSGTAYVDGHPAGSRAAASSLGLVFGTRSQLYFHMTVAQCLDLVAETYFVAGEKKRARIAELASLFEIGDLLSQRVRELSLGQRMRCEVVAALIHRPRVLLADEPTIGLDVIAKNRLRELIQRWLSEERATLLLTSHDLSDVEALCSRCILIDRGEKRFDGRLRDLKGDLADLRRIDVTVDSHDVPPYGGDPRVARTGGADYLHAYEIRGREIAMSDALARISGHYGDHLQDVRIAEASLEEVLARHYGRKTQ